MRPTSYSFIHYGKLFCNVGFRLSHMYAVYTSFCPSSFLKILHASLSSVPPLVSVFLCQPLQIVTEGNSLFWLPVLEDSAHGDTSTVPTETRIVWSPRVIDNYEPQDLNAGNWPWCLWKSSNVLLIPKISLQHQA